MPLVSTFLVPYYNPPPRATHPSTPNNDESDHESDKSSSDSESDSDDELLDGARGVEDAFTDASRDYSGSAEGTRQATFYFHRRWYIKMKELSEENVRASYSCNNKVFVSVSFNPPSPPYPLSPSQTLTLTLKLLLLTEQRLLFTPTLVLSIQSPQCHGSLRRHLI